MSKILRIVLTCLLVISTILLIWFYAQNSTGIFAISNMEEAMAITSSLDVMLTWGYIMTFAAILLVLVLSIINIVGNKKSLKKTGFTLLLAVVLVVVSYLCASGDPVPVNLAVPPTHATLKMTDTLLILSIILLAGSLVAFIWGGVRKLIQNNR